MPHEHDSIQETLRDLPLNEKLAHLVLSLIIEDKPTMSIENLLEVAVIMARHLPPSQQAAVVWYLNAAAAELDAKWN
jgi:hypothetical protein